MKTPSDIRDNILDLLKKRNITAHKMLVDCGYNTSLINDLKRGQMPSADKIAGIANYLGVSTDYIMGNHDGNAVTAEEDIVSELRRILNGTTGEKLSESDKNHLIQFAEMLAKMKKSNNDNNYN